MRVFFVVLACCFFATLVCAGQPVCVGETNNKLFSDLNSNVYVIRNSASRKLEQKMDFSLYLKLRDGKPGNAEYSHRFKYLVRVFEQKTREKYQPDLCGHPDYPWIFFNPNRPYAWRGLNHNDLYETYVLLVNKRGVCGTNANDWLDYRLATKIWLDERITLVAGTPKTRHSVRSRSILNKNKSYAKRISVAYS